MRKGLDFKEPISNISKRTQNKKVIERVKYELTVLVLGPIKEKTETGRGHRHVDLYRPLMVF